MRTIFLFACAMSFLSNNLIAQEKVSPIVFNGYLTEMQQYQWYEIDNPIMPLDTHLAQNIVHNRLNFHYYPSDKITFTAQFRNQFLSGDNVASLSPEDGFNTDQFFLPLNYYLSAGDKGLLSISLDRLYFQYNHNNIDLTIGRQRINWGQTFVWNPNDIFNTYDFFDFDYAERPGADAVRIQYYTGMTSQIDIAAKLDSASNPTIAGLFRFNKWNFDFQLLGGYYSQANTSIVGDKESDYVFGGAVTSDIKGMSFRTEASYFQPSENISDTTGILLASFGLDYTLKSNLFVGGGFLYISELNKNLTTDISGLFTNSSSIKNMSFAKYNLFAQASYPLTPLLNASFAGMYFTDNTTDGFYIGPSFDYSIAQNVDISLILQYFQFKIKSIYTEIQMNSISGFLRIKWSF